MIKLKHILNSVVLSEIKMVKGDFTVGRNRGNSLQLEDGVVSGEHAVFKLETSPYLPEMFDITIRDLGSTNGVYVNGKLVDEKRLNHGDVVRIGQHEFKVVDDQSNVGTQTEYYVPDE